MLSLMCEKGEEPSPWRHKDASGTPVGPLVASYQKFQGFIQSISEKP
jgi:hypothetical protein